MFSQENQIFILDPCKQSKNSLISTTIQSHDFDTDTEDTSSGFSWITTTASMGSDTFSNGDSR